MPNEKTTQEPVSVEARLEKIEAALALMIAPNEATDRLIQVIEKLDRDTNGLMNVMDTLRKQREDMSKQGEEIQKVKHKGERDRKRSWAIGLVLVLISSLLFGVQAASRNNSCSQRNAQSAAQTAFILGLAQSREGIGPQSPEREAIIRDFLDSSKPLDCSLLKSMVTIIGK